MGSPPPDTNVVYLLQGLGNFSNLFKIGITSNWPRRARELRIGEAARDLLVVPIKNHLQVEQDLHKRFASSRLPQSEWFALSDNQIAAVKAEMERQRDRREPAQVASTQPQVPSAPEAYVMWRDASREELDRRFPTIPPLTEKQLAAKRIAGEALKRKQAQAECDKVMTMWVVAMVAPIAILVGLMVIFAYVLTAITPDKPAITDPPGSEVHQPHDRLPVPPKPPLTQPPSIPTADDDNGSIGQPLARPANPPVPIPNEPSEPVEHHDLILPKASECVFHSFKYLQSKEITCSVKSRVNTNRHTVYDVDWADGVQSTYIFWADGRVEILVKGEPIEIGTFRREHDTVIISSSEGSKTIIPGLDPLEN